MCRPEEKKRVNLDEKFEQSDLSLSLEHYYHVRMFCIRLSYLVCKRVFIVRILHSSCLI